MTYLYFVAYNFSKFITYRTVRMWVKFPFVEMCVRVCLLWSYGAYIMCAQCSLVMLLCEYSVVQCTSSAICWTVIADNVDIQVVCMHVNQINSHGNHVDDNEENKTLWKSISTTNLFTFSENIFVINYLGQHLERLVTAWLLIVSKFVDTWELLQLLNRGFNFVCVNASQ